MTNVKATLKLYCTLCGEPLALTQDDALEYKAACGNDHRWVYVGEYLRQGDFAVFAVQGFQCDQERPYPEVAEAVAAFDLAQRP